VSSYLEGYGAGEERRNRILKWLALGTVLVIILGVVLYFRFRNYAEEKQIESFLDHLRNKDFKSAYALWGCTDANPCPNYAFEKFMEDWGPASPAANIAALKLGTTKSCPTGIIQFVEAPGQPEIHLWVDRSDKTIGFSPWPVCDPRVKVP
jgi:hypothetical protein